jgi:hypothetical protein
MRKVVSTLAVLAGIFSASIASATDYNEAVSGDLSGDRLAPTTISLTPGSNTITATSVSGDVEYYTLIVPPGTRLSQLVVLSSTSASLSFIAVQQGDTFTEPPTGTNVANLLGYTHFGPGNSTVGTDILDDMGRGSGAIDFTPPLAAGHYTFWSQETSSTPTTYSLNFVVTPQPVPIPVAAYGVLALGLAAMGAWTTRRRASVRLA